MAVSNSDIGAWGESEAVKYLRSEGFLIRHVNWRDGKYELDIVAERGEFVHFVEVKCRAAGSLQSPEEAFDDRKSRAMLKAANSYISMYEIDLECRVDLIAIQTFDNGKFDLRYIEDVMAFGW